MLLMGKKSRLLMSLALVATLITGCSSTKPKVPDEPPEVLYQKARIKPDTGNYRNAIELLEALLDQQKRQNALLRRLCEANEPEEKASAKDAVAEDNTEQDDFIRLVAER